MYTLSCSSTADVSPAWLEERGIAYVYFNFRLGETWYKDDFGASVAPHDLYEQMLAGVPATTSQVSTGDYIDFFRSSLEAGKDIVHVSLSSGISNTYNSAVLAAEQLREEFPERTIRIVDSLAASAGFGLLMDKLAAKRDEGLGPNELADWAEEHRLEVNHLFLSSDLTFFVRGGRISKAAGLVGGLLKVCPLMRVAPDGSLEVMEKIRTKARSEHRMLEKMQELAQDGTDYADRVIISHSDCIEDATDVARAVERTFPNLTGGKVDLFQIGATIGCHTGPGTVALFFWGNPSRW
jgi:DegV family protein with EDD domain